MDNLTTVEEMFVLELLKEHAEYISDMLERDIIRKNLKITEALLKSLHVWVDKNGSNLCLFLGFYSYGRAVEIQDNKNVKFVRKNKEGLSRSNAISSIRRAAKKDKKFYAKNVYGSLNRLIGRMQSGYSEMEIQRIKNILENSTEINSSYSYYKR